jgi:hypothetical protein
MDENFGLGDISVLLATNLQTVIESGGFGYNLVTSVEQTALTGPHLTVFVEVYC